MSQFLCIIKSFYQYNRYLVSYGDCLSVIILLIQCVEPGGKQVRCFFLDVVDDQTKSDGKAKLPRPGPYLTLTGTKQQSAAPLTDICYKSLAISSFKIDRGGHDKEVRNRHLSPFTVYSISSHFELSSASSFLLFLPGFIVVYPTKDYQESCANLYTLGSLTQRNQSVTHLRNPIHTKYRIYIYMFALPLVASNGAQT